MSDSVNQPRGTKKTIGCGWTLVIAIRSLLPLRFGVCCHCDSEFVVISQLLSEFRTRLSHLDTTTCVWRLNRSLAAPLQPRGLSGCSICSLIFDSCDMGAFGVVTEDVSIQFCQEHS